MFRVPLRNCASAKCGCVFDAKSAMLRPCDSCLLQAPSNCCFGPTSRDGRLRQTLHTHRRRDREEKRKNQQLKEGSFGKEVTEKPLSRSTWASFSVLTFFLQIWEFHCRRWTPNTGMISMWSFFFYGGSFPRKSRGAFQGGGNRRRDCTSQWEVLLFGSGAVTSWPSCECDITSFVKGRPNQTLCNNCMTAKWRRAGCKASPYDHPGWHANEVTTHQGHLRSSKKMKHGRKRGRKDPERNPQGQKPWAPTLTQHSIGSGCGAPFGSIERVDAVRHPIRQRSRKI